MRIEALKKILINKFYNVSKQYKIYLLYKRKNIVYNIRGIRLLTKEDAWIAEAQSLCNRWSKKQGEIKCLKEL